MHSIKPLILLFVSLFLFLLFSIFSPPVFFCPFFFLSCFSPHVLFLLPKRTEVARGTLPLAAAVAVELAETGKPVLAAGGVVNGRGLLAALALGCDGVVMGTRSVHEVCNRLARKCFFFFFCLFNRF